MQTAQSCWELVWLPLFLCLLPANSISYKLSTGGCHRAQSGLVRDGCEGMTALGSSSYHPLHLPGMISFGNLCTSPAFGVFPWVLSRNPSAQWCLTLPVGAVLPAGGPKSACLSSPTACTPASTSATNCRLHNPWAPSPGIWQRARTGK